MLQMRPPATYGIPPRCDWGAPLLLYLWWSLREILSID
ncbi:hypothetical protein GBAR_LOCUS14550 [Geodia barretti]|uniref:Uncharacterized protein n=1 Tax=Geodia barretti TaxID=519541 RepID=A0AA35WSN0_GEOBA|nr:hypothetical protein GBAR_LOCUS14550 [Geodia barretti]